jgi:hypothetical protein
MLGCRIQEGKRKGREKGREGVRTSSPTSPSFTSVSIYIAMSSPSHTEKPCFEGRAAGGDGEFMVEEEASGSTRGKDCVGAVARRDPARDGMEVDRRLAVTEAGTGTGTGWHLGNGQGC